MKTSSTLALVMLVVATMIIADATDARVGGGKSFGAQRPSVAPRASAPPAATAPGAASQPVMPATPGATLPAKPGMPAATPAPSGVSRWLGPIAGIAAGLGLAALLSHFGLPEGMGSFLLIALLVVGVVFALRLFFARRGPAKEPLAYATPRAGGAPAFEKSSTPEWGGAQRIEPVLGAASAAPDAARAWPPGFDAAGFVKHAKQQFISMQAAHDAGDRAALQDVLTPEMYAEVMRDLDSGPRPATAVVDLAGEVLEVTTEGDRHWASIRFTGSMREGSALPAPFDEVWNLSKPVDGKTGWLLAGIQQYA